MVYLRHFVRNLLLSAPLIIAVAGCTPGSNSISAAQHKMAGVVLSAQLATAEAILPSALSVQESVQEHLAEPASPSASPTKVASAAADLIIRWEVTSAQVYTKRYRRPVWPGGASGVTWGVGYDGGQQTQSAIGHDWSSHPHVATLLRASGVVGYPAKQLARGMQEVLTPYPYAKLVLEEATLPSFQAAARRALGPEFDSLPDNAAASLISLGYNRGWSMAGRRNTEKRVLRDECVPNRDVQCIATQLRAMKRLWPDARGLRDRRDDEARVATS